MVVNMLQDGEKTVIISKEMHQMLKDYSRKTGIKIKVLVDASIRSYLRLIKIKEEENAK